MNIKYMFLLTCLTGGVYAASAESLEITTSPLSILLTENIDSRLTAGQDLASNGSIFSEYNENVNYVRNTNFWAADIDLSCTSVYYSKWVPEQRRLTMVTPRHGVAATHYHDYTVGETYGFVGMDNTYHTRTIEKVIEGLFDITVILLSSDLPPNITPCKIAPSNWEDFLYLTSPGTQVATLSMNHSNQGIVYSLNKIFNRTAVHLKPTDPTQLAMYSQVIAGDSGSPSFFIYNDEPLLISLWWTTSANSDETGWAAGPAYPGFIGYVNDTIVALDELAGISTGYTVTEAAFKKKYQLPTNNIKPPKNKKSFIADVKEEKVSVYET